MKKRLIATLVVALFSIIANGCGGGSGNGNNVEANGTHSQNAPMKKLDPTILHPEFD